MTVRELMDKLAKMDKSSFVNLEVFDEKKGVSRVTTEMVVVETRGFANICVVESDLK